MDLGIRGKVALVAASSRGLGRASAEALAAEGVDLVLCARGEDALRGTAEDIRRASGVRVVDVVADVATEQGIARVLSAADREFARVDILVTNGGGPPAGPFETHARDAWDAAVRGTLTSVVELVRGVLPGMREQRWGRIVNVTSIAVKQPVDNLILSNSVRAAVTGFARTLANEVAPHGITVNNVMPGFTRTARVEELAARTASLQGTTRDEAFAAWEKQIPMNRLGDPAEFGAMVAFLCSTLASYTTGASIPVDGGWIKSLL
jgi:3-oxoacyl-[acyl-carrier protein] reductase